MWVAFAFAKATHIFPAKILAYMLYLIILMTSLVLNNWALGILSMFEDTFLLDAAHILHSVSRENIFSNIFL